MDNTSRRGKHPRSEHWLALDALTATALALTAVAWVYALRKSPRLRCESTATLDEYELTARTGDVLLFSDAVGVHLRLGLASPFNHAAFVLRDPELAGGRALVAESDAGGDCPAVMRPRDLLTGTHKDGVALFGMRELLRHRPPGFRCVVLRLRGETAVPPTRRRAAPAHPQAEDSSAAGPAEPLLRPRREDRERAKAHVRASSCRSFLRDEAFWMLQLLHCQGLLPLPACKLLRARPDGVLCSEFVAECLRAMGALRPGLDPASVMPGDLWRDAGAHVLGTAYRFMPVLLTHS